MQFKSSPALFVKSKMHIRGAEQKSGMKCLLVECLERFSMMMFAIFIDTKRIAIVELGVSGFSIVDVHARQLKVTIYIMPFFLCSFCRG